MKTLNHLGLSLMISIAGLFGVMNTSSIATAAPDGKITKRAFHYNNYKFWRAGSVNAPQIGSYGKKKRSTGIDIHDQLPGNLLSNSIKESGVYSINFKSLKRWGVNIDDLQYADVSGSGKVRSARKNNLKLKLVYLTVDNGPLINALNKNKSAKEFMKRSNSRVVSAVWVVVSAKVAQTFSAASSLRVQYKSNKMNITASAGGSGTSSSTITIPRGSIFAYMIDKAKWKKKGLKKIKIKALEDDNVGLR